MMVKTMMGYNITKSKGKTIITTPGGVYQGKKIEPQQIEVDKITHMISIELPSDESLGEKRINCVFITYKKGRDIRRLIIVQSEEKIEQHKEEAVFMITNPNEVAEYERNVMDILQRAIRGKL